MWNQLVPVESFDEALSGPAAQHASRAQIEHWRGRTKAIGRGIPVLLSGNPARLELVGALHAGGAKLVAGTDVGMPFVPAGRALHWELEQFVEAGLDTHAALSTATVAAAECLGRSDFGAVRVGLRADLLLLRENPLEDVRHVGEIAGVMTRGRWLSRQSLEERLSKLDGSTRPGWER